MKIPHSFKRGVAFFSVLTTIFALLFFLVDLDKNNLNNHEDLRNLEGGAIQVKVCGGVSDSNGDVVSTADRDSAKADREEIKGQKGGKNTIDQYLKDSSSGNQNEIIMGLIFATAPWLAFLVLSLLGWWCYFICCCYDCCCPPSKCCRCPPKDINKPGLYYLWPIGGGALFCLWVFIVSIIGLSKAGDLETGFKKVHCSIISLFDDVLNGALKGKPDEWVGIKGLLLRVSSFCDDMNNFVQAVTDMFAPRDFLTNGPTAINTAIGNLRTGTFDISTVQIVTPVWQAESNAIGSPANVDSLYFKNILPQVLTTMQTLMSQGITQINDAFSQLQTQGEKIKNDIGGFQNSLNSGKDSTNSMANSVDSFISTVNDNMTTADPIFSLITLIFQAYYGICLGLSILALLGIILLILFKKNGFRFCLHITWCFFCLLMVVGFLLSSILMPLAHVTMELCGVMDNMLSSKENFVSYPGMMSKSDADKYSVCISKFGGDGDILTAFGVKDKLNDVNQLKSKIDVTDATKNNPDLGTLKSKILLIKDQLEQIRDYGSLYGILDGTEINVAYYGLQFYTNYSTASSTWQIQNQCNNYQAQDYWVFQNQNCTDLAGFDTKIVPTNIVSAPVQGNVGQKYCFKFQNVDTEMNTRYVDPVGPGCTGALAAANYYGTKVKKQVNQIKLWYRDLSQKATDKLTIFNTANTGLNDAVTQYFDNITNTVTSFNLFATNTRTMIDKVVNPNTGILAQITCTFIGNNMFRLFDSLCVAFIPTIYSLSKIIIVISMGMFVGSFFLFCAGVRYSSKSKFEEEAKGNNKVAALENKDGMQY